MDREKKVTPAGFCAADCLVVGEEAERSAERKAARSHVNDGSAREPFAEPVLLAPMPRATYGGSYAESAGARSALTGERHSATLASAGGAAASSRLDKEVRCRENHE